MPTRSIAALSIRYDPDDVPIRDRTASVQEDLGALTFSKDCLFSLLLTLCVCLSLLRLDRNSTKTCRFLVSIVFHQTTNRRKIANTLPVPLELPLQFVVRGHLGLKTSLAFRVQSGIFPHIGPLIPILSDLALSAFDAEFFRFSTDHDRPNEMK